MTRQFLKFLVAGGVAAVANFGSRIALSHWMPYIPAIVLAYLIGMVTAFVLNRLFVFEGAANSLRSQAGWFTLVNLAAVAQTLAISLLLADHLLPVMGFRAHVETIAHGVGVLVPVATSYLGHKHLSFRTHLKTMKKRYAPDSSRLPQVRSDWANQNRRGLLVFLGITLLVAISYGVVKGSGKNNPITTTNYSNLLTQPKLQAVRPLTITQEYPNQQPVQSCNLAFINGENFSNKISIKKGTTINVGGWLIDRTTNSVPTKIWLIVAQDNSPAAYQSKVTMHTRTADVQQAFGGHVGYAYAGFISGFSSEKMNTGNYHLYMAFLKANKLYTCDNGRHISVQ